MDDLFTASGLADSSDSPDSPDSPEEHALSRIAVTDRTMPNLGMILIF
jgi:hypothetical protein